MYYYHNYHYHYHSHYHHCHYYTSHYPHLSIDASASSPPTVTIAATAAYVVARWGSCAYTQMKTTETAVRSRRHQVKITDGMPGEVA